MELRKLSQMPEFSDHEFEVIHRWYTQWIAIPKYLVAVSLGFLAFSLTDLLPAIPESASRDVVGYLRWAWVLLSCSTGLASLGLIAGYCAVDIFTRLHASEVLQSLHMKAPRRETRWVSRWGKTSYRATMLSLACLVLASLLLVRYAFAAAP